jgi:protein TonB
MLNTSSNLYKAAWLDLVFKDRNKSYGAYGLRTESSSMILRAFFIVVPVFVLLFAGPVIYKRLNPDIMATPVELAPVIAVNVPLKQELPQKKEPPRAEPVKEKLKTIKLPANIAVVDHPETDEMPPSADELKNAVVGQVAQSGTATTASATPVAVTPGGNGTDAAPVTDNHIYDTGTIEVYPEFEGGMAAWSKFIQRNLRYPYAAQEMGIQGKVFVSFVVEKDGSVSDVRVIKGIGGGCDEEAIRVITKSPGWKPGRQNGQQVRVRYTMPLSFLLN